MTFIDKNVRNILENFTLLKKNHYLSETFNIHRLLTLLVIFRSLCATQKKVHLNISIIKKNIIIFVQKVH